MCELLLRKFFLSKNLHNFVNLFAVHGPKTYSKDDDTQIVGMILIREIKLNKAHSNGLGQIENM